MDKIEIIREILLRQSNKPVSNVQLVLNEISEKTGYSLLEAYKILNRLRNS